MASKPNTNKQKPLLSGSVSRLRKLSKSDPEQAGVEIRATIQNEKMLRAYGKIDAIQSTSKRRRPMTQTYSLDSEFNGISDRNTMIATSRDLELNFSLFRGLGNIHGVNVVGTGPRLQVRTSDTKWNDRKELYFKAWGRGCDARGVLQWGPLVKLFEKRMNTDGDVGIIMRKDMKLQGIESDRIADPPKLQRSEGETYVHGVKVASDLRPISYSIWKRSHKLRMSANLWDATVDARDFILYADPERIDQVRGITRYIAAINDMQDMRETLEAVKGTQKLENSIGIGITSAAATSTDTGLSALGETTNYDATGSDGSAQTRKDYAFGQGVNVMEFAPGEDVKFWAKQTPGGNFEPFMLLQMRMAGLAFNMPLEIAFQYYSRGSFSSLKGVFGQYHQSVKVERQRIEHMLCDRIQRWVTRSGINLWKKTNGARGLEPPTDASIDVDAHEWQWDALPILEPEKQAKAELQNYEMGANTLKDINARLNRDFEETSIQKAREIKILMEIAKETGVPLELLMPRTDQPSKAAPAQTKPEEDDDE